MGARVKKRADTSTNRESDKFIVRLPAGMRAHLAEMAARHGKSMNAEVVTALAIHIARDGEPDEDTIKRELAEIKQTLKALSDAARTSARELKRRASESLHGGGDYEPSQKTQELLPEGKKSPPG